MPIRATIAAILLALVPTLALAGPACTTEPKDKWMSEADMRQKMDLLGYRVNNFEIKGSCYDVFGWTKDDKRAEVFFNPVTGDIVQSEIDG